MLVVVTGGAASGKSAMAEEIASGFGARRCYVATMTVDGEESRLRVQKHRAARAGKGFDTIERQSGLHGLFLRARCDVVLLECMSNLLANEMFLENIPAKAVVERICGGVEHLLAQTGHLLVVTNEIFGDAEQYGGEMADYISCLGRINRMLAQRADVVIESVCGLPLVLKGAMPDAPRY